MTPSSLPIMRQYYSHYSDETSLRFGEVATPGDVMARHQLLKERRATCIGEVWIPGQGYTTVYQVVVQLTPVEEKELCLAPLPKDAKVSTWDRPY
jgi:hypothetical protein